MKTFNPDRKNYTRTYSDVNKCPFCDDAAIIECVGLAGDTWRVLVNRFPYMDGNLMIVSRRHVETIEELTKEEWAELHSILLRSKQVLQEVFEVDSFNIGLNEGPQSGASIAHLHWELIPRKVQNPGVVNTLADIQVIKVAPEETKRRIDKALKTDK